MSDDDKSTPMSERLTGGGLTSEPDEERAEQAQGGSEDEEQAVRESTDQFDTGGTQ